MEKIVLVNPPNARIVLRDMYSSTISKGLYNWPNVDLLVLSGILSATYEVILLDANTLGFSIERTIHEIIQHNPIGICYAFGASVKHDEYQFLKALQKALPTVKRIGTGGLLYHDAVRELTEHPELGACLLNFTTDDCIRFFSGNYDGMHNVVYHVEGSVTETTRKYPSHGFTYALPAHAQLPLKQYRLSHGKTTPLSTVLTSYGCPAHCSYCVAGSVHYRYRDPENVLIELDELKRLGVKEIFFRDNTFCAIKDTGHQLLQGMINKEYGFSWVADTRANVVTEETAALMKKSGCHALHIGVESSNQNILDSYAKGVTLEQIRNAFALCKKHGIATVGYFILGLPGETAEDIRRTISFACELDCDYASFNMPIPIIGTELRDRCIKNNWLRDEKGIYDGSAEPLINTELLSTSEIRRLQKSAMRIFYLRPRYFIKALARLKNWYQLKMALLEFKNLILK